MLLNLRILTYFDPLITNIIKKISVSLIIMVKPIKTYGIHGFLHLSQHIHKSLKNMFNKSCRSRFNTHIVSCAFFAYD